MMTNTYKPIVGGLEKSVEAFAGEFRQRGHKIYIATPEMEGTPAHEPNIVRLPALRKFNKTDFSVHLPVPGLLSKLIKTFKPDLVHAHHPFLVGDLALRLCGQYHIPLIFTYHTMYEQYTHYLPLDNARVKRFVAELSVGFANLTDRVIAPSGSVRDLLVERGVVSPIDVVPTGVDARFFLRGNGKRIRSQFKIPQRAFVLGHLGRLEPEKNLEFLARSAARFLNEKKDAHFLIIGKGSSREMLETLFRERGVRERVHFAGVMLGQNLADAYHAMDLFAFTSKSETQGMVVTEAMAAGVPVVALDAPGARDVLRDTINGRVVYVENDSAFCSALLWCAEKRPVHFAGLCKEARKTAESVSIERCARLALEVYEKSIHQKRRPRRTRLGQWASVMRRIRTEWGMLKNFGKATRSALGSSSLTS
jgi:glycosyltransferase involved in cell wall biosynthesis